MRIIMNGKIVLTLCEVVLSECSPEKAREEATMEAS